MIEIPLTSDPEQLFSIIINETVYDVRVVYNTRLVVWSISLSQNDVKIISSVALVAGVDIFLQYDIGLSNAFVINLDDSTQDATADNLGTVTKLFILTDAEVAGG